MLSRGGRGRSAQRAARRCVQRFSERRRRLVLGAPGHRSRFSFGGHSARRMSEKHRDKERHKTLVRPPHDSNYRGSAAFVVTLADSEEPQRRYDDEQHDRSHQHAANYYRRKGSLDLAADAV
jgi:hypothetical protein